MPDITITITISGVRDPAGAARTAARFVKRSAYYMDAVPGESFAVSIEAPDAGLSERFPAESC